MDTEYIVAAAQISTGFATLLVAIFLATQLIIQRRQLDRTHRDAERDLAFATAARRDNIVLARLTASTLGTTLVDGMTDLSNLKTPAEQFRYQSYVRLLDNCLVTDWNVRRDGDDTRRFERQIQDMLHTEAQRHHYREVGRKNYFNTELRDLVDAKYEELEGRPIDAPSDGSSSYVDFRDR